MLIFHSYSERSYLADQVLADLSSLPNGNLTHSCSYCSYFFPTLRVQHLVGQVLSDLTHLKYQFHRFLPYSESSYLADQVLKGLQPFQKSISQIHALLWESIFGWKVCADQPTLSNGNLTDSCFECLYSFSTLRAQHLADQFFASRCPIKRQFHRILLYSGSSYLADQVLANLPSLSVMAISQIPTLTAHISFLLYELNIWQTWSWQIYPNSNGNFTDSCSDCSYFILSQSSTFGRLVLGTSPLQMAISQIPPLTAHILFFLWELNIWQALAWHIYPSFKWQFHRFLLWLLIFLSYSESSTFGRPNLGRSNTLSNGNFTDSCSDCSSFFPTLRAHI